MPGPILLSNSFLTVSTLQPWGILPTQRSVTLVANCPMWFDFTWRSFGISVGGPLWSSSSCGKGSADVKCDPFGGIWELCMLLGTAETEKSLKGVSGPAAVEVLAMLCFSLFQLSDECSGILCSARPAFLFN